VKLGEQLADDLDRKVLRHVEERRNCLGAPIIAPLGHPQLSCASAAVVAPAPPSFFELLAAAQECGEAGKRSDFGGEFGDGTLMFSFCLLTADLTFRLARLSPGGDVVLVGGIQLFIGGVHFAPCTLLALGETRQL
jgi:hypothetical protein